VTWSIYSKRETPIVKRPIDGIGLAMLVLWVGSLQIMLDKGKELDWFNSSTIVTLAVIVVIALAVFIAWELTDAHPVVDIRLFARRNFLFGAGTLAIAYGLFFGNVVLLPLWLQQYMGYTATLAGLVLAPVGVLAIVFTPLVGRAANRIDARVLVTGSFGVFALVLFMRAHFNTDATIGTLLLPTVIQGIGMAGFFIPLVSITLNGLPGNKIPAASGLSNFVRIMCGGIGSSIFTTAWDRRSTLHHAQLMEQANVYNPTFNQNIQQFHSNGSDTVGYMLFNNSVTQQAAMLGVNDLFWISSAIFIALIALIWITKPEKTTPAAAAAASAAH
jgi:DHA2 family multidrug resistance protein